MRYKGRRMEEPMSPTSYQVPASAKSLSKARIVHEEEHDAWRKQMTTIHEEHNILRWKFHELEKRH
jgi:hypothetical protein